MVSKKKKQPFFSNIIFWLFCLSSPVEIPYSNRLEFKFTTGYGFSVCFSFFFFFSNFSGSFYCSIFESVSYFFTVSNLLLTPSGVFFILKTIDIISNFVNMWNTIIINILNYFILFLILAHVLLLDWFQLVAFSPHYISCFSVFLCDCYMFLLYIRYSVFYLAECWVYLRYYKYSSALFRDAVKLRRNSLIISDFASKTF